MKYFKWKNTVAFVLAGIMLITGIPTFAFEQMPLVDATSTVADTAESTYESNLPVVYINTENGTGIYSKEDYVNATMTIQGNDTFSDSALLYDGEIEIRGRGNSTWGMPKKPYKIKLDKKSNLFNMGKHKHWVLLANYSDESLMRNTLAYNLSGAMGMPHMETVWVDVVLNGTYIGNYQFCEQVKIDDDNRVSIFDWESFAEDAAEIIATAEIFSEDDAGDLEDYMKEENMSWITTGTVEFKNTTYNISDYPEIKIPSITGGYLIELDEYYDEVSKFQTNSGQPIMLKNPEFAATNPDMMNYIQTYIQSFENAVQSPDYTAEYNDITTHYSELFDFDALVDYWLISEIFFNEELNKKSTYMYKDIDGPVYMGPIWDMDYSSGGEGETWRTNEWATLFFGINAQENMWYKDLIKDPYFLLRAQERYWEIRDTYVQDMLDSIDASYTLLKNSADANADIWYGTHNFDSEINKLKTWFYSHLSWLDAQMISESSLLFSLGYDTSHLTLSATDSTGNALPKDRLSAQIAANALVNIGESIILTPSSDIYTGETANVFVNGQKLGSVQIGSSIILPAEWLTADSGGKNIIEVKLSDDNKSAQNCITVIETDISQLPPEDPNKPEIADPEDDGRDYPTASMTAIADSIYTGSQNEGPAEYVLDGDEKTHWHTNWDTNEATDMSKRWIGVELAETTMVDGIRYLPRQEGINGTITTYLIQYRTTADEAWKTVTTGDWNVYDKGWKLVNFEPVEAKYIRVVGVHTYAENAMDAHMSMSELRVQKAVVDETDIGAKLLGHSLSLEGTIGVNFHMQLSDEVLTSDEAYMNFTLGGKNHMKVYVKDVRKEGTDLCVFKCVVPVKDMDTEITAQIILSESQKGTVHTYTVKKYIASIENDKTYESARALIGAMSDFGDFTSAYFNGETLTETEDMTTITIAESHDGSVIGNNRNIYVGSSLLLKSNTIIRHYFNQQVPNSKWNESMKLYYIDSEGIPAHKLGEKVQTTIVLSNAEHLTIAYGPLSYAYRTLNLADIDESLKSLMRAMYLYYEAAWNYKNLTTN